MEDIKLSDSQTEQVTYGAQLQELNSIDDKTDIQEFANSHKKSSTVNCTKRDMKIVYEYFVNKLGDLRNIESIPPNELDILLSRFYTEIRKRDGTEYEPGSINSVKSSIERYLKDCEYGYTLKDKEFNLSNRTLAAKMDDLKKQGKGQKPNVSRAVSVTEEETMWEKGQLGDSCPRVLIFSIWYYFTKCFGLRGRQEHRQLKVGDLQLKVDTASGREYIEYSERITKTRDKTGKENTTKVEPRVYATCNKRDPVELYKTYLKKRPEKSKKPDFPFYLTCIPQERIDSNLWYYPRPMGENYISKLMHMAAKECGFEHKTNDSVRKTCAQTLRKADIAKDKIKHITCQKNTNGIESYDDRLSDEEQIEFSDILTGEPSELFDTDNDDWAPTLNLGHKLACIMPKRPGKSNNKKRKIHNKPWANSNDAEVQVDNHVLKGSMMVPRVIFDESSDSLTLSKYKNLLSFTISVGEDGDCDIVPKIDDNENTHLELVLMPKAYLNDSGFRQASKTVSNYDINVKIEPEDPEYGESTCKRSSNMTNESEIMQESMEEYAPFHSGISDTVPNVVVENLDYISHRRLQTTLSGYNSDSSEPETKSLKLNCNDTSVLNSEDSSLQTYTENSMYIKKEVDDDEEEKQGNSMNQLKSYSIKFFIPKGFKNDKSESKPSILQRNTSKLSVHDLFKYLKTKISLNQTNEFYPWSVQMNSDYILFSQMAPVDFPVVSRQVMLNKDLTYTIRVHAQDLPEKHNIYGSNKKVLKSVTDIKHLLKQIDSYNTCSGNHDRRSNHFFLLHSDSDPVHPAIREGNFGGTTMNGSTYEWTIRSKACTLLVKSFLDKCPECNMYYKTAKSAPVPNAYGGE